MGTTTSAPPEPLVESVSVTPELHHICTDISKISDWQVIFKKHCRRTGKPATSSTSFIENAYYECRYEARWQNKTYRGASSKYKLVARSNLYQAMVMSIIEQEDTRSVVAVVNGDDGNHWRKRVIELLNRLEKNL